ncbi:MAG: sugar transferase [Pseudothermotoga sp.]
MLLIDALILAIWNFYCHHSFWQSFWFVTLICVFLYSMRVYEKEQNKLLSQLLRSATAFILSVIVYLVFKPIFDYNFSWKFVLYNLLFCLFGLAPFRKVVLKALRFKKQSYYLVCQDSVNLSFLKELQQENSTVTIKRTKDVPKGSRKVFFESEATMKLFNGELSQPPLLPKFVEKELKRIPIELIEAYPNYYKQAFKKKQDKITKRILDIVVAVFALVILSPVMLVTAMAIYFEDGRPIIFKQKRVAKDGKEFTVYKFRSMRNAVELSPRLANQEEERITKVGRFIRKRRIDEIPQFINVLKGDMSIVGPRPEQPNFHKKFSEEIPYFDYRLMVKPGITGWAQVNYKYASNFEEYKKKIEYDLWYVKNGSIWTDIKIILYTLETIIFGKGAL